MAARLGSTNLAVHAIFMQTASLFYTTPLGVATGCSITVGQFLGAGRGSRAKQFAHMGLVLNLVLSLSISSLLVFVFRPFWGHMFTEDTEVRERVEHHLPILFLYCIFDHLKCVCMAVLRGCGRAPITVTGNTLSCWLVGFPLAYILVFNPYKFELWGLWTAMSGAWLTACALYIGVILKTDWEQEVRDAKHRTERSIKAATAVEEQEEEEKEHHLADGETGAADTTQAAATTATTTAEEDLARQRALLSSSPMSPMEPVLDLSCDEETAARCSLASALAVVTERSSRCASDGTAPQSPSVSFTIRDRAEEENDEEEEEEEDDETQQPRSSTFTARTGLLPSDAVGSDDLELTLGSLETEEAHGAAGHASTTDITSPQWRLQGFGRGNSNAYSGIPASAGQ